MKLMDNWCLDLWINGGGWMDLFHNHRCWKWWLYLMDGCMDAQRILIGLQYIILFIQTYSQEFKLYLIQSAGVRDGKQYGLKG